MDLTQLEKLDTSKPAGEQLKEIQNTCYKSYPANVEPQDGKMNCIFFVFLTRLDPFTALNYIFSYDIFTCFVQIVIWWTLGYKTGGDKKKAGCAFVVLWLLIMMILAFWMRCQIWKKDVSHKANNLLCKARFWFWPRCVFYFIESVVAIFTMCAILVDSIGAWNDRDSIDNFFKDDAIADDRRNRMLAYKYRWLDSYDTELVAYAKAYDIFSYFFYFFIYGFILGFVGIHAVKRIMWDQEVGKLQAKAQEEEMIQIGQNQN